MIYFAQITQFAEDVARQQEDAEFGWLEIPDVRYCPSAAFLIEGVVFDPDIIASKWFRAASARKLCSKV